MPSLYVPVAENCCVVPSAAVALGGSIAIETSEAAVTVTSVDPLIVPDAAVIIDDPMLTLCANPDFMVTIEVASEVHAAAAVRSFVLPSV